MTILETFDTPERTVAAQAQVIEQLLRENQQLRIQQAKLLSCINEAEAAKGAQTGGQATAKAIAKAKAIARAEVYGARKAKGKAN